MRPPHFICLFAAVLASSCERRHVVLDSSTLLGTVTPSPLTPQLRVLCSFDDAATDPLQIAGTNASFIGVRRTLAEVSGAALTPWAQSSHRDGGWELRLEIFEASASTSSGRTTVQLSTRATLTAGGGETYAAQTRGYCKEQGADPPSAMYACMSKLTRDLERWIEGVPP